MRKATYIALALCAALCSPTMARADEINYLDSFSSGIETLKGNDVSQEVSPEKEFIEEYKPEEVRLGEAPSEEEDVTLLQRIRQFITNGLVFNYDGYNVSPIYYNSILRLLRDTVVPVAVLFVFFWWGLRKSKNIIMKAFRKGKANV